VARATPPNPDDLEISIIGPGRGECVILHLGNNEWCIVDSCIPRGLEESVATEYLSSFQNGALGGIKLVVATHWHDDHIRGLASILSQVPNVPFFCSAALNSDNFFTLVGTAATGIQGRSGVEEFASILGIIGQGALTQQAKRLATPKWAIENRKLLQLPQTGRAFPVSITAMSPSDGTVKLALTDLGRLIPQPGDPQRRITSLSPNHTSVVLWIEAGPMRALLGADLEHTGNEGEGWMAVLQCHRGRHESPSAALFKVPHHGSANGHHSDVWSQMLVANPIAVVTPFNSSSLPQESDLKRLAKHTTDLYCTSAGAGKAPGRDSVVDRTMTQELANRRVIDGQPGHVRVRWSIGNQTPQPTVELFHGAYPVRFN
jgi:hypothetical protein